MSWVHDKGAKLCAHPEVTGLPDPYACCPRCWEEEHDGECSPAALANKQRQYRDGPAPVPDSEVVTREEMGRPPCVCDAAIQPNGQCATCGGWRA